MNPPILSRGALVFFATLLSVGCSRITGNEATVAVSASTGGASPTRTRSEPEVGLAPDETVATGALAGQATRPEQAPRRRNWPNWMGPNYDGVSDEKGWSTRWPRGGLPTRWTAEIGIGFSSITIVNERLYTMGHKDGVDTIYCLDVNSGELIWRVDDAAPLVDNLYEGGPGSTPTIEGDHVFYVTKGGRLQCLAVEDGKRVWHVELQKDLDVELPEWGFNGSPYLLDDLLILEAGRVVAYDKDTGEKRWQTAKHTAGYGSATHFEQAGHKLVATLDSDGVRIVAANSGRQIAFYPWKSPFRTNSTTPIIRNGRIFIASAYNVGCGLFELKLPDKFSLDTPADGDPGELELLYSNRHMRNHFNNSIYYKGYFYGFDGNSNLGRVVHLTCIDAATGKLKWRQRGLGCGSLMIADGKLILLSEDGHLVVADATPDGYEEIARTRILEGRCWTVPLLLNGSVFARNAAGKLVRVDLPTETP